MIDSGVLKRAFNAGSIISIQESIDEGVAILMEDGTTLTFAACTDGYLVMANGKPLPEEADDTMPLITVSATIWPGQNPRDWLKVLDAAVHRAQGVL